MLCVQPGRVLTVFACALRSVPQTLFVLHRLMFVKGAKVLQSEVDFSTIKGVSSEQGLVALVIEDMVFYKAKVRAAMAAMENLQSVQPDLYTFDGHYHHIVNIERRLQFMSFVMEIPVRACIPNSSHDFLRILNLGLSCTSLYACGPF